MIDAATVFDALGDATRRAIFERVATRPRPVVELTEGLGVSRPAVSQHLRVLKSAGLVQDRQQGTRRIYSTDPRGVKVLRDYLDRILPRDWDEALGACGGAVP
jgi:DNA-binding transcriptional ArsR family regulator